jgi:hypothetical protein
MRVIQPQPLIGLASRSPRVGPGGPPAASQGQRRLQASGAWTPGSTCLRSRLRTWLVVLRFGVPGMPTPVTADWVGECRVPTASEGPERIGGKAGGKAEDALPPGRINGKTRDDHRGLRQRRGQPVLLVATVCVSVGDSGLFLRLPVGHSGARAPGHSDASGAGRVSSLVPR